MKILFWNLKKNDLSNHIKDCLLENDIDIAIFCECKGVDFSNLSKNIDYNYIEGNGGCDKLAFLCKKIVSVKINREQSRYILYNVIFSEKEYIIAAIHLHDRGNTDSETRIACAGRLVNDIANLERSANCKNTIIIGDFNANPWDKELLQANSFNAVLYKDIIRSSESRTIDGISYRRFYNPTIDFLSEKNKSYGSFYYIGQSTSPIWHCLDQILLSKNLIDNIVDIKYLKSIKDIPLVTKTKPNDKISDHLPLLAKII